MSYIDDAHYQLENEPAPLAKRTYGASLVASPGPSFTRLDKVAYSFATLMALGPLAIGTWGAMAVGT